MKVIELLNMISKGEEVPKKIKYRDWLYEFEKDCNDYMCQYDSLLYRENDDVRHFLNDEVEIIEEEKKTKSLTKDIEALGYACGEIQKCFTNGWTKSLENKSLEEEHKIPEKLEDISEIKCVGCKVEINIAGNKTLFDTDTPIVTEHCIYKINQLIKNQKKILDYLEVNNGIMD